MLAKIAAHAGRRMAQHLRLFHSQQYIIAKSKLVSVFFVNGCSAAPVNAEMV
jgi:hypothetical protein